MVVEFRFWPRDETLIGYFLRRKKEGLPLRIIPGDICEDNVYATEPWNLPSDCFKHGEHQNQGFFFTTRQPISSSSSRRGRGRGVVKVRRTAGSGTWHGQGHLTPIYLPDSHGVPAGHKTTLTFKKGDGTMTDWLMQEYVLNSPDGCFQDIALCRIYKKPETATAKRKKKRYRQEEEEEEEEEPRPPPAADDGRTKKRAGLQVDPPTPPAETNPFIPQLQPPLLPPQLFEDHQDYEGFDFLSLLRQDDDISHDMQQAAALMY